LGHLLGSNYIVSNYGMPGATMLLKGDGAYPTWGTGYADSTTNQPDIVVIMLGTNDSKPQNWAHKIDFISDYKRLIHHYQNLASHPKVYLNTCPFCYGENAYGILATNIQNEIVPEIKQIAREESLPWIDVNTATMGMPQNFPDNVHPNAAGATFMAKVVYDSLKKPWTDSSTLTPTQKPAPPGPTPHF
jgi:lysophospholipase L1-like esterase